MTDRYRKWFDHGQKVEPHRRGRYDLRLMCRSHPLALFAALIGVAGAEAAWAGPLNDDLGQRRSIRGRPVETGQESDALRQLREFEQSAFPAPDRLAPDFDAHLASEALGSPPERALATQPTEPLPAWLKDVRLPDFPIKWDARVVRYLEFYKNDKRGRAIMSGWLRAQGRWRPMMEEALRRAHLPLGLIYVAMIESGYDPLDHSHAGAVGLWQFMPENSRIYGLRVDFWVDERRDPEKSTEAAMRYFGDLQARFGGWPLALAAFNAGYGALLRAMQKYNTNDYWQLCRHEDGLPWDTVLYVPKWMAAAIVGENRALFGYDKVISDTPYSFDRVTVRDSISLAAAAHAAGVSSAELEALNPELRRKRTPPEPWKLRLPRGSGPRFAAAYDRYREKVKPFVVRFGERLEDLAHSFGLSEKQLRALNGIEDSSEVSPGLVLVVPDAQRATTASSACDTLIVAVPDKDLVVPGRKRLFYRTLAQDGLNELATFFKVKPAELAKWNHLDVEAKLTGNLVLQVWAEAGFDESKVALVDPARVRLVTTGSDEFFDLVEAKRGRTRLSYTIKKGDDLKHIGKKFGLTVADLERINRFGAQHTELHVGQKITVYREMTKEEKEKAACKIVPSDKMVIDAPSAVPKSVATPTATLADPVLSPAADPTDSVADENDRQPVRLPKPPPPDGRP
jgi:membrane-bound lytic murein transglycosylase D